VTQDVKDAADEYGWGSPYPGGAPIAMADGSVHNINYGVDYTIMIPLSTPNGGEVFVAPF
jgi:prepilin-type processing-associated H-X9-DG protein